MAVLCGMDAKFPMQLWCRILRQAEHQLNLLLKSRVVPNISAFACLYGQHVYNANPFAPLGTAVEMHVTPANRKTYEAHTKTGFYVGNSWEHYRCHEIWIADTRSVRVGETVFFKHKYLTQPAVTMSDAILRAGDDLCQALKGVISENGATRTAVDHLMDIFKKQARKGETVTNTQRVLR